MDRSPHHHHFPAAASPVPTFVPISLLLLVPGEPNLKVPKNVTAWLGETLKLLCHFPCKLSSYEKYWCKWGNKNCKALPSQNEAPRLGSVSCDEKNQLINLILQPVTKEDEGWYWCGVKDSLRFGETVAVHVAVKERAKGESPRARPACPQGPQRKGPV